MRPEGVSGKAVVSLTLSIIGLFVIPVIISAIAILIGWGALADIGRRPALGGKGLAVSGVLIGVIGLVIGLVAVIIAASYSWLVVYLF